MKIVFIATLTLAGCSSSATSSAVDAGADAASDGAFDAQTNARGSFGAPCAVGQADACDTDLICLEGPNGGAVGFCTKTCPATSNGACSGAPAGTAAYCIVTNANAAGDKACVFLCAGGGRTFACPGQLACADVEEPEGSGQRLCLP